MTGVLGLDLSTARTGVADKFGLHSICPRRTTGDRGRRLSDIVSQLDARLNLQHRPELAVIEAPFAGRNIRTLEVLAELQGAVKARLFERGIDVAVVSPSSLKEFATGRGGASKDDMVAAAEECGVTVANDDEADAWWLQAMGRWWADGWEPPFRKEALRQARREAVTVVKWPQLTLKAGAQ